MRSIYHRLRLALPLALLLAAATPAAAQTSPPPIPAHPAAEAQALELAKQAIALRSVQGPGNKTGEVAQLLRDALVRGGYAPASITITPVDDTAYMLATWQGSDPALKPLVISGHMDVVEAKPADWQRDPFTPVVENGYLFGRGATDMKLDDTLVLASLLELRRAGYQPRRTVIFALSGDEETSMKTSRLIADRLAASEYVLNIDGGVGTLDEKTGAPLYFTWQGAEKSYADFALTVTNPGGHSSMPRPDNAIVQLAQALGKIGAYHFAPQTNELSHAWFTAAAKLESDPTLAAAIRAYLANPADPAALATLRADPTYVGKLGTTCVPTMISGGHAQNALPQQASANINCRIFPGVPHEVVMAELQKVVADPAIHFADVTESGTGLAPASPMRADFVGAVERAIHAVYPGVPVFPSIASGASDNMWFRAKGIDSYTASPVFIKNSEDFSHGLNERTPIANIRPAIDYYLLLLRDLTK